MERNLEMSRKYGLHIFNSGNYSFPFFVEEFGDCFNEEEIKDNLKDWQMIEGIQFDLD